MMMTNILTQISKYQKSRCYKYFYDVAKAEFGANAFSTCWFDTLFYRQMIMKEKSAWILGHRVETSHCQPWGKKLVVQRDQIVSRSLALLLIHPLLLIFLVIFDLLQILWEGGWAYKENFSSQSFCCSSKTVAVRGKSAEH